MALTEREQKVLQEIKEWELKLYQYEPTDFEMTYHKWLERSLELIPEQVRKDFFAKLDNWLFHLHAGIQGTQLQLEARQRILTSARTFADDIEDLSDLKNLSIDQLTYLANHQIAKHKLYSFAQGGLTGAGGLLLLGSDIPTMTIINLRVVQLIAMTYGYEVNTPYEMMTSLKVFHAATIPNSMQHRGWEGLIDELNGKNNHFFFYEGSEVLTDESWIDLPLKQIIKAMFIMMFRRRLVQGVPLVGMAIGAGMNYQLTRKVTEYANKYYQLRYLKEKEELTL
ncbi:EcsC family protein [Cytobacillus sp. S13-E01]|uniref:EcsC family protein n=1 Tax=Cytobacillus sp. S13-E01 TaxID=3031326 RepID=UPI0023D7EA00|nr:EcsC family protein [Cytobacillus sp. S13-E01]MDF0727534.1 EcsC family protein [Cytobacillus sp. S13-E01]